MATQAGIPLADSFKMPFFRNIYEICSCVPDKKGRVHFVLYIVMGGVAYVSHGFHYGEGENQKIIDELVEGIDDTTRERLWKHIVAERELPKVIKA